MQLTLSLLPSTLAVCRLDGESEFPAWAQSSSFLNIARTSDELSVVCDQSLVPDGVKMVAGWRAFKVEGPLDFSLTGIVSSISAVLADNKISIFVVSTFDTDYILVQEKNLAKTKEVLGNHFVLIQ